MAKVRFPITVKYKRKRYPAHTPFEVDEKDVKKLVEQGAFLIEEPKAAKKSVKKDTTLNDIVDKQNTK